MIDLRQGDCKEVLKSLPDNSVDSIVTDPPYELGFMGKSWDSTGIANDATMWAECLRVLKPGGHLLAFSGTRTYHRMASAIEDAGFEVRDMIEWVYGSGFPKSLNIGKVTDKFLKTGNASWNGTGDSSNGALGYSKLQHKQDYRPEDYSNRHQNKDEITEDKAKQWEGWGTQLKPAHEPICMARKPLSEKTVAENCLKWGTGGINIDKSRVGGIPPHHNYGRTSSEKSFVGKSNVPFNTPNTGRFPANLIHDNSEEVRECFPDSKAGSYKGEGSKSGGIWSKSTGKPAGMEYGDSGNASRFFKSIIYQAKASKAERNMGCEGLEENARIDYGGFHSEKGLITNGRNPENRQPAKNNHPTVKPIKLMEYLIEMVTPESGTVLEPFMGSGTTGIAAVNLNRNFIGIELDAGYFAICENRIADAEKEMELKKPIFNYKIAPVI